MGIFDFLALVVAALVVGLALAGELKDVMLCELSIRLAGDSLRPRWRRGFVVLEWRSALAVWATNRIASMLATSSAWGRCPQHLFQCVCNTVLM